LENGNQEELTSANQPLNLPINQLASVEEVYLTLIKYGSICPSHPVFAWRFYTDKLKTEL